VAPVDTPQYFVLDKDTHNELVMKYWNEHPKWAAKNKPNGFPFTRLRRLVGGWQSLPGWHPSQPTAAAIPRKPIAT
jgi:hypothetical protein